MSRLTKLELEVVSAALSHAEAGPTDWEQGLAEEMGGTGHEDDPKLQEVRDAIASAMQKINAQIARRRK